MISVELKTTMTFVFPVYPFPKITLLPITLVLMLYASYWSFKCFSMMPLCIPGYFLVNTTLMGNPILSVCKGIQCSSVKWKPPLFTASYPTELSMMWHANLQRTTNTLNWIHVLLSLKCTMQLMTHINKHKRNLTNFGFSVSFLVLSFQEQFPS